MLVEETYEDFLGKTTTYLTSSFIGDMIIEGKFVGLTPQAAKNSIKRHLNSEEAMRRVLDHKQFCDKSLRAYNRTVVL